MINSTQMRSRAPRPPRPTTPSLTRSPSRKLLPTELTPSVLSSRERHLFKRHREKRTRELTRLLSSSSTSPRTSRERHWLMYRHLKAFKRSTITEDSIYSATNLIEKRSRLPAATAQRISSSRRSTTPRTCFWMTKEN